MTTCGKCGAENAAGDAFCGSCGAFLEFAAEEAVEQAAEEAATSVGGPPAGAPAHEPSAAEMPSAGPSATPAASASAAGAAAGGPTCAICGRANPVGRTFCISCGERLGTGASGATAQPGAAAAAAGPASDGDTTTPGGTPAPTRGPARPAWDFPTAPVPKPTSTGAPAPTPEGPGGRSRLPLVAGLAVVLVVIGGGAAFIAAGGLGGGGQAPATAGPAPSGAATAAPGGSVGTGEPAATAELATAAPATAVPTPAPTTPGAPSVGIKIISAKASSQVSSRPARNLIDGSPATAWKNLGSKPAGSWVELRFAPSAVTRIQIFGGWQRDEPLYYGNHRPHNVTVSFDGGDPIPLELKDVLGAQRVDIPPELGVVDVTRIRITIADVYRARKTTAPGSPSKAVAISEIRLFGVPVTP